MRAADVARRAIAARVAGARALHSGHHRRRVHAAATGAVRSRYDRPRTRDARDRRAVRDSGACCCARARRLRLRPDPAAAGSPRRVAGQLAADGSRTTRGAGDGSSNESMTLKIDVFNHIFPKPFFERLQQVVVNKGAIKRWLHIPFLHDVDVRFRRLDEFGPDYRQMLSLSAPPIESINPDRTITLDLARLAND